MNDKQKERAFAQQITTALRQQAVQVEVSSQTTQHILNEIQTLKGANKTMKSMQKSKKIITAAVAIVALSCTTAIASSGVFGITSHNLLGSEATTVQAAQQEAADKLGFAPALPDSLCDSFQFKESGVSEMQATDEDGNGVGAYYYMLDAVYKNQANGEKLDFFVDEYPWDAAEVTDATTKLCGDTTVYYTSYVQKMVPPSYQATAEDEALMAAGGFNLAYGSDKVEEKVVQQICWQADGVKYSIMGYDVSLSADDFFAMAEDMLV